MTVDAKPKGQWGGRRANQGAKPLTDEQRLERALKAQGIATAALGPDPVASMVELIGLSPRVAGLRPDLAATHPIVPVEEHVNAFLREHCRYTQLGEIDPENPVELGDPFELVPHEREFLAEALACDENGRRIFKRAGMVIGRKNRKTTLSAGLSLYFGSPADGEHRPSVIQAAGVKEQAGKLYQETAAFVTDRQYGSDRLRRAFVVSKTNIICPANGGDIKRVAGDGDNNHSLDPHGRISAETNTGSKFFPKIVLGREKNLAKRVRA